ncbi:hypothetical protein [Lacisediminimonas profundi]|uniref:hypothetical protein n=1 Tax=Lacisediminimonas profundi TaxID=2603856 RepID=UPI00124B1FDD|nr:hypothetical protein [Lacisediminimonas profundi]
MDLVLIEIVLWVGLAFFFWALRDNLGKVEAELQDAKALKSRELAALARSRRFVRPERLSEPIGHYRDAVIHRIMSVDGHEYLFDHVCPPEGEVLLQPGQCYVEPGLVYARHE